MADNEYKDEYQTRLAKLEEIRKAGINPYPAKFDKKNGVSDIQEKDDGASLQTAGRIVGMREMGKLVFCHLQDEFGKAQIALKQDDIGKDKFKFFTKYFDMGDFVGVTGEVFTTNKGERTLLVKNYELLSKALLPLPEKWHGLKDEEARYRQRYLDLISNAETMERFKFRSRFIKLLREFYGKYRFEEVDTPILANEASGALAKPFRTHHNALDTEVYLRIAPEIYLKECVVGGYERVFEVARCFRNEGMDPSHLQDFTMVEHYAAYWDFENNMRFTEKMFEYILDNLLEGKKKIEIPDRDGELKEIDFSLPWKRVSFRELLIEDADIDIDKYATADELREAIKEKKVDIEDIDKLGRGNLIDALYKVVSRSKLIDPTFLTNHPLDLSPLARKNDDNPKIVDRFQLVINTWEIINAYSEIVDPVDQEQRFSDQASAKEAGDEEAHGKDDEYVEAMKHGMPPMSGWGMGVERIVALLTGQTNLRDVVLFPLMKPKNLSNSSLDIKQEVSSEEMDLGIDMKKAKELLGQYLKEKVNILHSIESMTVMRALAKHFKEDEEKWGIIGLLHDIDWELTKDDTSQHSVKAVGILKDAGATDFLINTIQSHCYDAMGPEELKDKKRTTRVEHALASAETLTGLIIASALMQPDKKLASVKLSSLKKKFKTKKFAANCNRDIMMECEKIGLSIDEFLEIGLKALQGISDELGL